MAEIKLAARSTDLEFRAITQWLSLTNGLGLPGGQTVATAGPSLTVANPPWYAGTKKSPTTNIYPFAANLTNLHVRQHEVVAVTLLESNHSLMDAMRQLNLSPNTPVTPVTKNDLDIADINPGFVITQNFRRDDARLEPPHPGDVLGQLQSEIVQLTGNDFPEGITAAKYYVDNIEETARPKIGNSRGRTKLSSKISFGVHSDNLICLLRRMRLADTQVDLQKAFGCFKTYVIVSSCDKMSTRLYRGGKPTAPTNKSASDTKNPATKSGEQTTPPDKKRNFFITLTSNDTRGAQNLGNKFLPPDVKPLSAQQIRSMRRIVSFLKTHGKINTLGNYPPADTKDWYGVQGRLYFQAVLAALLSGFAKSLDRLVAFKKDCHKTQTAFLKKASGAQPADDSHLHKLTINTNYWMTHLDLFREMFSTTIFPAHFNWLEAIAGPQDGQRLRPGSPLEQRYANDTPGGGSEDHNEDDGSFAGEEAQDTELADLDEIAMTSWSKAAIAYLNLLMLHAQGISSLGRYEVKEKGSAKQISSIIMSKAGFRLLIVKPEFEDRAMAPLEDVLGKIQLPSGRYLSPQERAEVIEQLQDLRKKAGMKKVDLEKSFFGGTCHCETVLICLQLLARKRAGMMQTPTNEGLPDKAITDLFLRSITVMPVSKHCCPACNSLVSYYTSTIGKVLYPGGHKNWSACSLPSWILSEAAEHMLKEAKKALGIRLEHLLQKRPPAPPSSSGAKSPDADLSMYTEEASQLAWGDTYSP